MYQNKENESFERDRSSMVGSMCKDELQIMLIYKLKDSKNCF